MNMNQRLGRNADGTTRPGFAASPSNESGREPWIGKFDRASMGFASAFAGLMSFDTPKRR